MLNTDDIKNLATLSRIHINEAEMEGLRKDMDAILGYVAELGKVATEEAVIEPTLKNVMRDDVVTTTRGQYTDVMLKAAPKTEGQFVKVKKILE